MGICVLSAYTWILLSLGLDSHFTNSGEMTRGCSTKNLDRDVHAFLYSACDNLPGFTTYCCCRVGEMTTYGLQLGGKLLINNIVYICYFPTRPPTNIIYVLSWFPPTVATRLKHNDSQPRNNKTSAPSGLLAADYAADSAYEKTASYRRWYQTNIAEGATSKNGSTISGISTSWESLCGDWRRAWARPNNGGSISGSRGRRYGEYIPMCNR